MGTNGKMLQVILTNPEYSTLPTSVGVPQWRALLDLVVQRSRGGVRRGDGVLGIVLPSVDAAGL